MDKHKEAIQLRMQRERDQRIQSILGAAQRVFIAEGYTKAIMDKIALEAGITKPTIYQYFKTKDDLFFTLMLPVIEELRIQLSNIETKLTTHKYRTGKALIRDLFSSALQSYKLAPETFLMIQFFQETGLVGKLDDHISRELNDRGRHNFVVLRLVIKIGMEQGLIKKMNVNELADVLWGLFVGIIHLEHIKGQGQRPPIYLNTTMKVAEDLIAGTLVAVKPAKKKLPNGCRSQPIEH
ncbi:MAG: TetR/AcrR family transcriptional regulator [Syntrophales bacterium]|jgi:AcrR family transcriptional regulator